MNRITASIAIGILIAALGGCEAMKAMDDAMNELVLGIKPPKPPEKPRAMPPECQNLEAKNLQLMRKRREFKDELYACRHEWTPSCKPSEVEQERRILNSELREIKYQESVCHRIRINRMLDELGQR